MIVLASDGLKTDDRTDDRTDDDRETYSSVNLTQTFPSQCCAHGNFSLINEAKVPISSRPVYFFCAFIRAQRTISNDWIRPFK